MVGMLNWFCTLCKNVASFKKNSNVDQIFHVLRLLVFLMWNCPVHVQQKPYKSFLTSPFLSVTSLRFGKVRYALLFSSILVYPTRTQSTNQICQLKVSSDNELFDTRDTRNVTLGKKTYFPKGFPVQFCQFFLKILPDPQVLRISTVPFIQWDTG